MGILKKIRFLILSIVLFSLISCKPAKKDSSNKIKILSTYFPQYDWTRSITGGLENETIQTLLIKNGLDLHYYQPDQNDISQLTSYDLLIYIGGESDKWIDDILSSSEDKPSRILNLYKIIESTTGTTPPDEHIWLSLDYAKICCNAITETLKEMVPGNSEKYQSNYVDYIEQLNSMDSTYKSIIKNLPDKPLIICDRFPFYYISENYGLKYFSALPDCTKQTSAPTEIIDFLASKLNEYQLNSIFVLDDSDKKISKSVILAAKKPSCDTFTLDSMQCTSLRESMGSTTYLDAMHLNLETIQKALN